MAKKPVNKNGNYLVLIIWSGLVPSDIYDKGDVVEVRMVDKLNDKKEMSDAVGSKIVDNDKFVKVRVKNKNWENGMELLKGLYDPVANMKKVKERKYNFDLDDIKIKDKELWEAKDLDDTRTLKKISDFKQPSTIVIN